jgi:hypothetical protein
VIGSPEKDSAGKARGHASLMRPTEPFPGVSFVVSGRYAQVRTYTVAVSGSCCGGGVIEPPFAVDFRKNGTRRNGPPCSAPSMGCMTRHTLSPKQRRVTSQASLGSLALPRRSVPRRRFGDLDPIPFRPRARPPSPPRGEAGVHRTPSLRRRPRDRAPSERDLLQNDNCQSTDGIRCLIS